MNLQKLKRFFLHKDRKLVLPYNYVPVQARVSTEAEAVMVMLHWEKTAACTDSSCLSSQLYYSPKVWKQAKELKSLHKLAKQLMPHMPLRSVKAGRMMECASPIICRISSLSSPRFVLAWKDTSCIGWWVVIDPKTGARLQTTAQLTAELAEPYILKTSEA